MILWEIVGVASDSAFMFSDLKFELFDAEKHFDIFKCGFNNQTHEIILNSQNLHVTRAEVYKHGSLSFWLQSFKSAVIKLGIWLDER